MRYWFPQTSITQGKVKYCNIYTTVVDNATKSCRLVANNVTSIQALFICKACNKAEIEKRSVHNRIARQKRKIKRDKQLYFGFMHTRG